MALVLNFPFITIVFSLTCGVFCAVLSGQGAKRLCLGWLTLTTAMSGAAKVPPNPRMIVKAIAATAMPCVRPRAADVIP